MYWRTQYIREADSADLDDTYKLDLPKTGLLGSLFLRLHGKAETGNPMGGIEKWRLIDYLDKIEVLANGDVPIVSASGKQLQYLTFLDQKVVAPRKWSEYSQETQREYILVNFGRQFRDFNYGLDLARFDSVELHITNSCTSTNWQDDLKWTVQGVYLEDAPARAFNGYLRKDEWRKWTTVADETKYLELPTTHIIRRIVLQAIPDVDSDYVEETSIFNLMDDIELRFKSGALRVFKGGIDDLLYSNFLDTGQYVFTGGWIYHTADKGFDVGVGYVDTFVVGAGSKDGAAAGTIATPEAIRYSFTQKMETYEADSPAGWLASGIGYHGCAHFRFDDSEEPGEWLNPDSMKQVELDIHTTNSSSAADGTNVVVLDRYIPY